MTVVVGWTPDRYGRAALEHGVAEADLRAQPLVVVNATKGDALVDPRFAREEEATSLDAELARLGVPHQIRRPVGADVAEQIIDVVMEVDASVLVIGLRHRTAVGKLLMGSTAQRILLDCPCPVLAVKDAAERP
jgi:nucleotide-binding universal stress UspA family protein